MTIVVPSADKATRSRSRFAAPPPVEPRPEDFDISSGFRLIRRRFWSIVILAGLLTAALVPAILAMKSIYHAEARVMIRSSPATTLDLSDSSRSAPPDIASEIERMLSRGNSEQVIRELKLADLEEFNPASTDVGLVERLRAMARAALDRGRKEPPATVEDEMESIVQRYYRALTLRRDGLSNVVQIGFNAQDPVLAASVPAKLLEVYLGERAAIAKRRFEQIEQFVQQRIAEQRERAHAAREAVRRYREAVGPVSNEAQAGQVKTVADLGIRLREVVVNRERLANTIVALAASGREAVLQDPDMPPALSAMWRDLALQQGELDLLLKTYGDNAEPVVEMRAKLAALQSAFDAEVGRHVQTLRSRLAGLDREKTDIEDELAAAEDKLSRSALAQTELESLLSQAGTEQAALDRIEQERRSLADHAAMPVSDVVEVLSPAAIPLAPQGRGRLFYLAGAFAACLMVALTVAFIREMLDGSVRSQQQLSGTPGLVPAGLLPLLRKRRRDAWPAESRAGSLGIFGESIRSVLVSLWQTNGGRFPASIIVTSALDGEGKSFVARALALELVAARQSVLLVDGDVLRGTLGAAFDAGTRPGLNELLGGEAELADVIHHDSRSGVDIIPRGTSLLYGRSHLPDLSAILRQAQANGQIVVVDSAPVLASTDTVYLAGQVERTLMVVRWGRTSVRAVEFAAERLRETSRSETLVVLNKVNPRRYRLYGFKDAAIFAHSLRKYHPAAG